MIISMTGYGRFEVSEKGTTVSSEVRCVNSRFLDISLKMPRQLSHRESDIKDLIRKYISRGKLNVSIIINKDTNGTVPISINTPIARSYYKLLNQLRKSVKLREQVKLEHLLQFSDIFEASAVQEDDESEWDIVRRTIEESILQLNEMRKKEGKELSIDLEHRLQTIERSLTDIEQLSRERIPEERKRLEEKVRQIVTDPSMIDSNRLELEILLLAEKLDLTEEIVRFRSHQKFFQELLHNAEPAGRKLNFLLQEVNRETNTIASKANDASISRLVVTVKEELEKIREQIQNIE